MRIQKKWLIENHLFTCVDVDPGKQRQVLTSKSDKLNQKIELFLSCVLMAKSVIKKCRE